MARGPDGLCAAGGVDGGRREPARPPRDDRPGRGDGAADDDQATQGPLLGAAANSIGGATSIGSAAVDHGSAGARTSTTVDASVGGGSFCFPPHCSSADAAWADTLTFEASGVPNGTTGSFTAEIAISGPLSGVFPPEFTLPGAIIFSNYSLNVSFDEAFESVGVNSLGVARADANLTSTVTFEGVQRSQRR